MENCESEKVHSAVKSYYSNLNSTSEIKTSACSVPQEKILPYKPHLKNIPCEIISRFYGCGMPIPFGIKDLTVLDLGCGAGRDCYISSSLVGEHGKVIGIDMLDEPLEIARKYADEYKSKLGYRKSNLHFYQGYIENISAIKEILPSSIDLVISNCVINLCPQKESVFKEVFRILKDGGEMYFSDLYSDRRISKEAKESITLLGEGMGGAQYCNDFLKLCREIGFLEPREYDRREIDIYSKSSEMKELKKLLGETKFYSITYRLFKLDLEPHCEDYGQYAIYKGTIENMESAYLLDNHHKFEKNKPKLVCGNTADMLSNTWLKRHFEVIGDKKVHYGVFPCDKLVQEEKIAAQKGCC